MEGGGAFRKVVDRDQRSQRGDVCTTRALLRVGCDAHAQRLAEEHEVLSTDHTFPGTPPTYSELIYTVGFLV